MAAPVNPNVRQAIEEIMPLAIKALFKLASNWRAILALSGLVLVTGFSFKIALEQAANSVGKFWWIAGLACLVLLGREYIKGYFKLRKQQIRHGDRNGLK